MRADESGEMQSSTIDVERLVKEGDISLNIPVQPNDLIYVTKADEQRESILVVGAVNNPGIYPVPGKGTTLLEVLFKAGGFTKFASPNRTRIMRVEDGVEKGIRVRAGDLMAKGDKTKDVILQAGDVVLVPESIF
jgi:polysaccharide export outer membrane protein